MSESYHQSLLNDVYIVEAVRTPIGKGKKGGMLNHIHPVHLMSKVLNELIIRTGIPKDRVNDFICGCVSPIDEQGANIARLSILYAGFPQTIPGIQINRMCGSSQQATHFAHNAIAVGDMDCVIAGGIEMMSVVPFFKDASPGLFDGTETEFTKTFPYTLTKLGQGAEMVAEKYNITREACDDFAMESHHKLYTAYENGYMNTQLVQILQQTDNEIEEEEKKYIDLRDEGIRWPANREKIGQMRPAFKENGIVTAANASQISDGASAIMLCNKKFCDEFNLRKRAKIVARHVIGSDFVIQLDGPIEATRQVLKKANMTINQIDIAEVNEAFATVSLAWIQEIQPPPSCSVNPNGGAIAHGHPLGATGTVLMTKLLYELERTNKRYGLQVMCIGHGMSTATIIERLE